MKEDKVIDAVIDEEKPFFFPRLVAFIIDSILVVINSPFEIKVDVLVNWLRTEKKSPTISGECANDII